MLTPIVKTLNRIEKESWTSTSSFQLEVLHSLSIRRNSGRKPIQQWRIHNIKEEITSNSRNRPHVSSLLILPIIILLRVFLGCKVRRTISQELVQLNHKQPYAFHSMRIIIGPRVISQTKGKYQVSIRWSRNEMNQQKMSAFPLSCRMNSMCQDHEVATDRAFHNFLWEWASTTSQ